MAMVATQKIDKRNMYSNTKICYNMVYLGEKFEYFNSINGIISGSTISHIGRLNCLL